MVGTIPSRCRRRPSSRNCRNCRSIRRTSIMSTSRVSQSHSLTERPAWKALAEHFQKMRDVHMRSLFADDPTRGERLTVETAGIYFDYSKNRVTNETIELLLKLAEECGLRQKIDA